MEISGVFLLSLARAAVNLRVLAGAEWENVLGATEPGGWYPKELFTDALEVAAKRFRDAGPVLERVGYEMMRSWYDEGPGRSTVGSGPEFLRFQVGSKGYRSLVRGLDEETGAFALEHIDDTAGTALVTSTTPFPRALERGVLLGGIQLGGNVDFVSVTNERDPSRFEIVFR
jgi:hypothetical protein